MFTKDVSEGVGALVIQDLYISKKTSGTTDSFKVTLLTADGEMYAR